MTYSEEHQAFINAIYANWDDDAPRLVYCDWLEERDGSDKCLTCEGSGRVVSNEYHYSAYPSDPSLLSMIDCPDCNGKGELANHYAARAEFIRLQIETHEVRAFCRLVTNCAMMFERNEQRMISIPITQCPILIKGDYLELVVISPWGEPQKRYSFMCQVMASEFTQQPLSKEMLEEFRTFTVLANITIPADVVTMDAQQLYEKRVRMAELWSVIQQPFFDDDGQVKLYDRPWIERGFIAPQQATLSSKVARIAKLIGEPGLISTGFDGSDFSQELENFPEDEQHE
jgi:uncharacterized protein (TIGR02996 family)